MELDKIKNHLISRCTAKNSKINDDVAEHNVGVFINELEEFYTRKAIVSFSYKYLYDLFEDFISFAAKATSEKRFQALASSASKHPFLLEFHGGNKKSNKDFKNISANECYPLESKVVSYKTALVYAVTEGRNAWHSTWIKKTDKMNFFSTFDNAKNFCEGSRVQGSIFTINEVPAVVIDGEKDSYLFIELGSKAPFSGQDEMLLNLRIHTESSDNVRAMQVPTLWECAKKVESFLELDEPYRKGRRAYIGLKSLVDYEVLDNDDLNVWFSCSNGGEYLLGWNDASSTINTSAIRKLVSKGYYGD